MNLFRVSCSCGFECHRAKPAEASRKCPKCGAKGMGSTLHPPHARPTVADPNGKTSMWTGEGWQ